jgi:5-hydroxyisourate hydrolase-like protein (transthyretin family)
MKKAILLLSVSFLMVTAFSSFECKEKSKVLLVLQNVFNQERFSVFQISEEKDGTIVATNMDEYPVENGVYRIEGSSNDKYYHKKVLVVN